MSPRSRFYCRMNNAQLRAQQRMIQDGIKNKVVYEGTVLDPTNKPQAERPSGPSWPPALKLPPPYPGRAKGEERTLSVLFLFACLTALGYSKSKALDLVLQTAIYGLLDWESKLFLECILKMFKLHFLLNAVPLHHWPIKCTSKIPSLKHWCMADWDFSDSSLFLFFLHPLISLFVISQSTEMLFKAIGNK